MTLSLTTREIKSEAVDTCNEYDIAPVTVFQINIGFPEIPNAPLVGEDKTGAFGTRQIVENFQMVDHPLLPLSLPAFTRQ